MPMIGGGYPTTLYRPSSVRQLSGLVGGKRPDAVVREVSRRALVQGSGFQRLTGLSRDAAGNRVTTQFVKLLGSDPAVIVPTVQPMQTFGQLARQIPPAASRALAARGLKPRPGGGLMHLAKAAARRLIEPQLLGSRPQISLGSFTNIQQDCGGAREWFRNPGGAWPCGVAYVLPNVAVNANNGANTIAWGSNLVEIDAFNSSATYGGWATEAGPPFIAPAVEYVPVFDLAGRGDPSKAVDGVDLPYRAIPYQGQNTPDDAGFVRKEAGYREPIVSSLAPEPYWAFEPGVGFVPPTLTSPDQWKNPERPPAKERQGKWFLGGNKALSKVGKVALVAAVGSLTEFAEGIDVLYKNLNKKHQLKHKKGDRIGAIEKLGAIAAGWGDLQGKWNKVASDLIRAGLQDLIFGGIGVLSANAARNAGATYGFQMNSANRGSVVLDGSGGAPSIPKYWKATGANIKPTVAARREAARQKSVTRALGSQTRRQTRTNFSRRS